MSISEGDDTPFVDRAEALLDGWPAKERSAVAWEDWANATMARVRVTDAGSTSDELLAPPLVALPDEPTLTMEGPKLADIARAAIADDTATIARDGLLAAEHGRREPMPSFHATPASERNLGAAGLQSRVAPRPAVAREVRAYSGRPESEYPDEQRKPGFAAGMLGGAFLALAACAAFYVVDRGHDAERLLVAASAEPRVASAPAPRTPLSPATSEVTAHPTPTALSLDDLKPLAPPASANTRESRRGGSTRDSLGFRVEKTPKDRLVLAETGDDTEAPGSHGAPRAEPPPGAPIASAPPKWGTPSIGALQAAIGSVMAGARSCLAGQDAGSRAEVTFGSDGRVKSVGVSGPAAGTPAEGCLRSAIGAARVPPFSEPSFSASLTIRPP